MILSWLNWIKRKTSTKIHHLDIKELLENLLWIFQWYQLRWAPNSLLMTSEEQWTYPKKIPVCLTPHTPSPDITRCYYCPGPASSTLLGEQKKVFSFSNWFWLDMVMDMNREPLAILDIHWQLNHDHLCKVAPSASS